MPHLKLAWTWEGAHLEFVWTWEAYPPLANTLKAHLTAPLMPLANLSRLLISQTEPPVHPQKQLLLV